MEIKWNSLAEENRANNSSCMQKSAMIHVAVAWRRAANYEKLYNKLNLSSE